MWNPEPRVAEEKRVRVKRGNVQVGWGVGGRQMEGKCLITTATRKEQEEEPERRRAIRPAAVIRFHLNPWTLNDFPRVETACQRCVCDSVCVRAREKEKGSVSTLTSAVQTPRFTASAPLSIVPCSLYAPSLSLYSASARPPPRCVTATAIYSSRATLTTLISLRLPAAFFFFFSFCWPLVRQSACFDLSDWFLDWLSVSPLVGHSDRL